VSPPDFLIIGAQKSGTTWLDRNLRLHPDLWLPPEKELHFFDFPPWMPWRSAMRAVSSMPSLTQCRGALPSALHFLFFSQQIQLISPFD
jgi:hypothetical protein